MPAYPTTDTAALPLDQFPPNTDIAVGTIDAGAYEEYSRPDLASFVRRHRWVDDARRRIPMSPWRFDEDADQIAEHIRRIELEIRALSTETIAALTARIAQLETQQINMTQMRVDLDALILMQASDITRDEIVALLSGGIDAGNVDLLGQGANQTTVLTMSTDSGVA